MGAGGRRRVEETGGEGKGKNYIFQAEEGIGDRLWSRGLRDMCKRQGRGRIINLAGLLAIVYGAVIGWLVRDIMAYRPPSRRKRIALNKYWQGWPAMIKDLRKVTKS